MLVLLLTLTYAGSSYVGSGYYKMKFNINGLRLWLFLALCFHVQNGI